jgi:hypothetical protein
MRIPLAASVVSMALIVATSARAEMDPYLDCRLGFVGLLDFVIAQKTMREVTEDPKWMVIEVRSKDTSRIYAFTDKEHYAFPTVILRTIYEENGAVQLRRTACGYGDKDKFDQVMLEFEQLDDATLKRFKSEGKEGGK